MKNANLQILVLFVRSSYERLTKKENGVILFEVNKMEAIQKENFLREIRPYVKEMVEEIFAESFRKGEMREFFEDLALAKAMEKTEEEANLSHDEALKQIIWK